MLKNKNILLIISGGIAAYKVLDLIRLVKKNNGNIETILTKAGHDFVTPLSISSLSQSNVYCDNDHLMPHPSVNTKQMTHIELSRQADLIIVAPASADIMAKMAHGLANDLASTTLLAANKPILLAPAMNKEMWLNHATQSNIKTLKANGIIFCDPVEGDMACGESGIGRMQDPEQIFDAITDFFYKKPLKNYNALVTAGPTYEAIDPVRFLGNRSSGKQGYAIATALRDAGAQVTLISGPTNLPSPQGVTIKHVENAKDMLKASLKALPVNIAICAAAVSDWTPSNKNSHKIKKNGKNSALKLELEQTPDILKSIATHENNRPDLVIGFAAETQNLEKHAEAKLNSKKCDWIIANEVGLDENGKEKTFGADENQIYFISQNENLKWMRASKQKIAQELVQKIIEHMSK